MRKRLVSLLLIGVMTAVMTTGCGLFDKDPAFNMNAMYEAEKIYRKEHPNFTLNVIETSWEDIQTLVISASVSRELDMLPDILLIQDNAFHKNVIGYPGTFMDITDSGIDFSAFAAGFPVS